MHEFVRSGAHTSPDLPCSSLLMKCCEQVTEALYSAESAARSMAAAASAVAESPELQLVMPPPTAVVTAPRPAPAFAPPVPTPPRAPTPTNRSSPGASSAPPTARSAQQQSDDDQDGRDDVSTDSSLDDLTVVVPSVNRVRYSGTGGADDDKREKPSRLATGASPGPPYSTPGAVTPRTLAPNTFSMDAVGHGRARSNSRAPADGLPFRTGPAGGSGARRPSPSPSPCSATGKAHPSQARRQASHSVTPSRLGRPNTSKTAATTINNNSKDDDYRLAIRNLTPGDGYQGGRGSVSVVSAVGATPPRARRSLSLGGLDVGRESPVVACTTPAAAAAPPPASRRGSVTPNPAVRRHLPRIVTPSDRR
jgi:hypothetical protein